MGELRTYKKTVINTAEIQKVVEIGLTVSLAKPKLIPFNSWPYLPRNMESDT